MKWCLHVLTQCHRSSTGHYVPSCTNCLLADLLVHLLKLMQLFVRHLKVTDTIWEFTLNLSCLFVLQHYLWPSFLRFTLYSAYTIAIWEWTHAVLCSFLLQRNYYLLLVTGQPETRENWLQIMSHGILT